MQLHSGETPVGNSDMIREQLRVGSISCFGTGDLPVTGRRIVLCMSMLLSMVILSGCPEKDLIEKDLFLVKTTPPVSHFFEEDLEDRGLMIKAIDRQQKWFQWKQASKSPGSASMTWLFHDRIAHIQVMLQTLEEFKKIYLDAPDHLALRKALVRKFDFYKVGGKQGQNILFTGYYTPVLKASRVKSKEYPYPLYRLPSDLVKVDLSLFSETLAGKYIMGRFDSSKNRFLPYFSREEIDWHSRLEGTHLEIAFLSNYIDQFFLHIQGGGILELTDGTTINVNYAGKNGRRFIGVGKPLIQDGEINRDQMSMQAIRRYFEQNPDKIKHYCTQNESYIFYEEAQSGPYGSLGVIVTPERSIAMDKKLFPGGALCLIRAKIPIPVLDSEVPLQQKMFSRFVLDQDTGGAIIGKHIDLYCGAGPMAASQAGSMNSMGDVYFLLLKEKYCNP